MLWVCPSGGPVHGPQCLGSENERTLQQWSHERDPDTKNPPPGICLDKMGSVANFNVAWSFSQASADMPCAAPTWVQVKRRLSGLISPLRHNSQNRTKMSRTCMPEAQELPAFIASEHRNGDSKT